MNFPVWHSIKNIKELDTPALVIYPERVKENIRLAIEMAGSPDRLRPHVKTHKSPDATRLQLQAGIRQFKCATIAEAEMLATTGAEDVLLAYQPVGPKADRLTQLIKKYPGTRFSCLIDHPKAAAAMAWIFAGAGLDVPVYLDLDLGMGRTGIVPGKDALDLFTFALKCDGIHPIGLHAYDGHIRDVDFGLRTQKCDTAFAITRSMQRTLESITSDPLSIIVGGSPTFSIHCHRPEPIQCSPGTFIYWDKGYLDSCEEQPFRPAALVITRVISQHGSRLTLDLGHKSIAAENDLSRRVSFMNGFYGGSASKFKGGKPAISELLLNPGRGFKTEPEFISQSEEHLVIDVGAGHGFQVGDVFYGVPYHVCPTIALYERAYTVDNGQVTGEWKTVARDRTLTV